MKLSGLILWIVMVCGSLWAQPQHVGVLGNGQFESQAGGNGAIYGLEVQNVETFRIKSHSFRLATNVQFSMDEKVYRHQYGGAVRVASRLRYDLPKAPRLFVQGGAYIGGIYFPSTPGTQDGYVKYVAQPIAGAGAQLGKDDVSVTVNYAFLFKRQIYARAAPNFAERRIDGWDSGQRIGLETAIPFRQKWLFLLNASHGRHVYQRDASSYGPALAAVQHRFSVTEVSIGIGRKYG